MNDKPNIEVEKLKPFTKFIYTLGQLPSSYLASMSYEEQLTWLCNYLAQTVIPTVNNNGAAVSELQDLFTELQDYVNEYFENLDVQEEINAKLDSMASDGTLTNLIKAYIDPIQEAYEGEVDQKLRDQDDEIANFKNTINSTVESISDTVDYFDDKLDAATNGAPLAASSTSDMTDTSKIYVNTTDGYWYYYDGTSWQQGGVYQTSVNTDDVDYLLNVDNSRNEVDYDILSNILELSDYTNLCKNNLVHLFDTSGIGLTVKKVGLNKFNIKGTANADGIIKISKPFTFKANTTYTFAVLDYEYSSSLSSSNFLVYTYQAGTTNSVKDASNNTIRVEVNTNTLNKVQTFTIGNADISAELGIYQGNGIVRDNTARVIIIEGNHTLNDIKTKSNLHDTLINRKFGGTVTPSSVIPTATTPMFYLGFGKGPWTNFSSTRLYRDCDSLLFFNGSQDYSTWNIQVIKNMSTDSIARNSIQHITTSFNPTITTGKFIWGIADTAGTYSNLLNSSGNAITLSEGEVAIISITYQYDSDNNLQKHYWVKDTITNLKSKAYIDNLIPNNIETYVYEWLTNHPEATTTVEDGSITIQKLDASLANKANRVRVDSNSSATYEPNHNDLNTVVGANNMANGIGSRNTIVGIDNLQANSSAHSANYEIAVGYHSLFRDWDGDHNVSVGNEAMDNVSHGSYNTAIGSNALRSQKVADYGGTGVEGETANYNTSVGGSAMYYTYGDNNTAVGHEALRGSTYGATGSNNVAIGNCAGKYNTNESNKLFIDDRDRESRTNENSKALIVGTFDDDPANQEVKINGKFGCNGATPQASVLAKPNASDLQSAITLLNQIKQVLIDNGILK